MATKTTTKTTKTAAAVQTVTVLWDGPHGMYCAAHAPKASRYLASAIKSRPRAKKISTPLGDWIKMNFSQAKADLDVYNATVRRASHRLKITELDCVTCGATYQEVIDQKSKSRRSSKTSVKVSATDKKTASKKTTKKTSTKKATVAKTPDVTTFYAVKFSDGYFLRTKTSARITYTSSFRDAKQFRTYDGALGVEADIRDNYDFGGEDGTTLHVVKVVIDDANPKKTSVRRVGTMTF